MFSTECVLYRRSLADDVYAQCGHVRYPRTNSIENTSRRVKNLCDAFLALVLYMHMYIYVHVYVLHVYIYMFFKQFYVYVCMFVCVCVCVCVESL